MFPCWLSIIAMLNALEDVWGKAHPKEKKKNRTVLLKVPGQSAIMTVSVNAFDNSGNLCTQSCDGTITSLCLRRDCVDLNCIIQIEQKVLASKPNPPKQVLFCIALLFNFRLKWPTTLQKREMIRIKINLAQLLFRFF